MNVDYQLYMYKFCNGKMDLIHYSFAPLILFHVLYTLDLLPYYLLIANGAGGVSIFELLIISMFCIEAFELIIR